jgi:hypothetical protein
MRKRTHVLATVTVLFALIAGVEALSPITNFSALGFVGKVEARVGRPLTPVSVAGVGRRTVRRCAVGVYNC